MHVFAKSMHVFAKSFPFFLRNFAAEFHSTAMLLTLGIAQTSLALRSLNRNIVPGFTSNCENTKMKHTATNRRRQAAMTFTNDCLNILTQLEDRLSVMVDQRVEDAVERKFRQMNINNNK